MDPEMLIGMVLQHTARGYNSLVKDARLLGVDMGARQLRFSFPCKKEYLNPLGKLHGGCVATLVDILGTAAIIAVDRQNRPGVTTDLNVTYMDDASEGQDLTVVSTVLKCGKDLAFVSVDIQDA